MMRNMMIVILAAMLAWTGQSFAQSSAMDGFARNLKQQIDDTYGSYAESPITTGILYDLALPLSGMTDFNGSSAAPEITADQWQQAAFELRKAALTDVSVPSYEVIRDIKRDAARDGTHPLLFLNYRYNRIKPDLTPDQAIQTDANSNIHGLNERAFEERRVFAAATTPAETYRGSNVRFTVNLADHWYSNDAERPDKIEVDLDDGLGVRTVNDEQVLEVRYSSVGQKHIRIRAAFANGSEMSGTFRFDILSLDTPQPTTAWPVQAALQYNGVTATGEAYVLLSPLHTTLTKPAIISEGIDFDNSLNWDELYTMLNQENLIETLRLLGFDAVVLNYTESTTYMQANAFLVTKLIQMVNDSIGNSSPLVLIGASMGGLTTRYALTYMEANSLPHNVRALITFDSPHAGANIPLGLQYWINFFASQSADAALMRDALNTPAARQMLLTHFTTPPSATPGSDPMFQSFLTELAGLGDYPTQPQIVAVANGSGAGANNGFLPGNQIVRWEYRSLLVDINGNVWALNNAAAQQIFLGDINRIWPLPDDHQAVTVNATWPWDNAPGGYRATMAQLDSIPAPYGDIIALHPNHCFIPTISALDLNTTDPFYNIAGDPDLMSHTPFDTVYFPADNQDHVTITPESFWWFLEEVGDTLPTPQVVAAEDLGAFSLHWSPVIGARSYHVFETDDLATWPVTFTSTADTTYAITTGLAKYYRVQATAEPITGVSLSRQ